MPNKAQAHWRAFRLYRLKGFTISEKPGAIEFAFHNVSIAATAGASAMGFPIAIVVMIAVIVVADMLDQNTSLTHQSSMGANFATAFFVVLTALMVILYLAIYSRSRLSIRPGQIVWEQKAARFPWLEPEQEFAPGALFIPVDEIRNIDVRLGGHLETSNYRLMKYTVVIWHGPHPIYTVWAEHEDTALALKEGVTAAIGLLNQAAPSPTGAPNAPVGWD